MIDIHNVPKVWLDFMDRDHEAATEITNRLMAEVDQSSPDKDKITAGLKQLLAHCQEHFASEEKQMQNYNFPPYPVHKAEHERVLTEMSSELVSWHETNDMPRLKHYLFDVLSSWFVGHIATMDTVTASFIINAGGPSED